MEGHSDADKTYYVKAVKVLNLATNARNIYESSKLDEKQQLLKFLLSNCELREENLELTLQKPFDAVLVAAKSEDWLR